MRCPQPPVAVSRPRRGRARAVQGLRAGVGGAAGARPLRNLRFWGEPLRVPAEQDAKRGDSAFNSDLLRRIARPAAEMARKLEPASRLSEGGGEIK